MQSKAATVDAYLAELPADRRASLQKVRAAIKKSLHKDFEEGMLYGMIAFYVPHSIYPAGYHCDPSKPLSYMGLAAQKNHLSFYAMCLYMNPKNETEFREAWAKSGKKNLDMGKSCIRFQSADDIPLDLVGKLASKFKPLEWASFCEKSVANHRAERDAANAKKTPAKKRPVKAAVKKSPAKKKAVKK